MTGNSESPTLARMDGETDPERLWQQGADLHRQGRREAALAVFERLAATVPERLELWRVLTALNLELNLPTSAMLAAQCALRLAPADADCHFNVALVAERLARNEDAETAYLMALQIRPDHYGTLCNLPMLFLRGGRHAEALRYAAAASEAYPRDPWLHYNRGDILGTLRMGEAAEQAYSSALRLDPQFHRARYAMSIAIAIRGDIRRAYAERRAALAAEPALLANFPSPFVLDDGAAGGDVRPERVAVTTAFAELRSGVWDRFDAIVEQYARLVRGDDGNPPLSQQEMPYLSLTLPLTESIRQQVARQTAATLQPPPQIRRPLRPPRSPNRRLHIGYLSADFRPHPVPHLMGRIYARHDRSRFRIHAYSLGPAIESPERAWARDGSDVFRDIAGLPADAAAQLIANDGIDILVDLSGYTQHTKPEILALRPAPLQVSYIGYVATMGARFIDYALLDREALLPDARPFWDEKIVYLPHCFYHCERAEEKIDAPCREALGLPAQGLVLGALHHPRKLEPRTWACWMSLLAQHPEAVLWLLYEDAEQKENLYRNAEACGVTRERLVFAESAPHAEHLARLRQADMFLDTFIYNGHTTTVEALNAGVPVVTLSGASVVSRIAGSMLKAHGLPELVAATEEEYRQLVSRLATDREWRLALRKRLSDDASSNLFCPERKTAQIETAYETMWARQQSGLPPDDFDVPT